MIGLYTAYQEELVPVPGTAMLGDAQAKQPDPLRFKDHVLGREIAVAAAPGGVDMHVEKARHVSLFFRESVTNCKGGRVLRQWR